MKKILLSILLLGTVLQAYNTNEIKLFVNKTLKTKNINCNYDKPYFRGKDSYNNEYYHIKCKDNKPYMFMLDLEVGKGRLMLCSIVKQLGIDCNKQLN